MAVSTGILLLSFLLQLDQIPKERREKTSHRPQGPAQGQDTEGKGWETLIAEVGSTGRREGPAWARAGRLDLGGSEASTEPTP